MATITDLNAYRNRRYVRLAQECGWEVAVHDDGAVAKLWVYSIQYSAKVRASGQLLQSIVPELRKNTPQSMRDIDVNLAGSAIALLDKQPDDPTVQQAGLGALANYFSRTRTFAVVPTEALRTGLHMLVVDWPSPNGNGHILRPALAIAPHILTPEQLITSVKGVLDVERARHPQRLPKWLRSPTS